MMLVRIWLKSCATRRWSCHSLHLLTLSELLFKDLRSVMSRRKANATDQHVPSRREADRVGLNAL